MKLKYYTGSQVVDILYSCLDYMQAYEVIKKLAVEPSAEVREVVRGEWKEATESIGWEEVSCAECSVCGKTLVLGDYTMDDIKFDYNYCPNCGAEIKK